jgi:transcription termination factor NusA
MAISLQLIKGIGPAVAKQLAQLGFNSAEDLAEASADALLSIPGFGTAKASQVIQDAASLVAASTPPNAAIYATAKPGGADLVASTLDEEDELDDESAFEDDSEIDDFADEIEDEFFDGPAAPLRSITAKKPDEKPKGGKGRKKAKDRSEKQSEKQRAEKGEGKKNKKKKKDKDKKSKKKHKKERKKKSGKKR